jgi:Uma2 family endonuclease
VTAMPYLSDVHSLLTIAEYSELGETESGYTELQEGRLLMSPSPIPDHNLVSMRLAFQLDGQLPGHVRVIQDVDVNLELAPAEQPGFSRRPDLVIVSADAVKRVRAEGGLLRASDVHVVIEIVSPGSRRTDYVVKHGEYADAGIGHYWIVDITEPVSLVACHLAGELGYQNAPDVTGTFTTVEPFELRIQVDQLLN